jgi:hypothetical protein
MNTTIIYYTANMENPEFENKIIENLKRQAGDIPIISVSRKPMDLGKNICIGEQPVCYSNSWKQLLLGLKEAKTRFCLAAESDCLYPPEYFQFIPPRDDLVYRYNNVWCSWKRRSAFYKKPRCEGAQMCGRKYWIERLEAMLGGHEGWQPMETLATTLVTRIFPDEDRASWGVNPVITFKTGQGMGGRTSLIRNSRAMSLPYWGDFNIIYNQLFK